MNLSQALNSYLTLNFLLTIGFIFLFLVFRLFKLNQVFKAKAELELHYGMWLAILLLTVFQAFLPDSEFIQPVAKIWSAETSRMTQITSDSHVISLPAATQNINIPADRVTLIWIILALLVFGIGSFKLGRDLWQLFLIKKSSYPVRQLRSVQILINDQIHVPFSYGFLKYAYIVLPSYLVSNADQYRMAMVHELQHHRQRDTQWVYVMWALKLICVMNPFVHLWNRWICELQEFACDETLVDRNKVESQAYASCLLEVAETAVQQRYQPVCAAGLLFLSERHILNRRIEKMFNGKKIKWSRSLGVGIGFLLSALMVTTAYASKNLVQDRRVTMAQAQQMAKIASAGSEFPIVVNEMVLQELNRLLGTPSGREYMKKSLQRMQYYKSTVEDKIQEYNLPIELMAIPIIESGYQNKPQSQNKSWGAGLWMFISSTARVYGLKVNSVVDERLDVDLETDAAMRYLSSNYLRFKNWWSALLGYNIGENRVSEEMLKHATTDPWVLVRNGVENDSRYLPQVMAAILIMKNPDSVQ